jgi:hypothetical protein
MMVAKVWILSVYRGSVSIYTYVVEVIGDWTRLENMNAVYFSIACFCKV